MDNDDIFDAYVMREIDALDMAETEGTLAADLLAEQDDRDIAELILLLAALGRGETISRERLRRVHALRRDVFDRIKARLMVVLERLVRDETRFASDTLGTDRDARGQSRRLGDGAAVILLGAVLSREIKIGKDASSVDDLLASLASIDEDAINDVLERHRTGRLTIAQLPDALGLAFAETRRAIIGVAQLLVQHARAVVTTDGIQIMGVGAWVKWVSILDSKTTAYCRGQSGKIYRAGEVPNPPPAHWGCRSTLVPFFPDQGEPNEPTYSDWLRKQSRDKVEDILGKRKAAMFLDEGVALDRFTDREGRELTIKQLAAKRATVAP